LTSLRLLACIVFRDPSPPSPTLTLPLHDALPTSCGTPVLGTPVGATPELLDPLDPTLVFDAATPEAIGERLVAFLECLARDPGTAARLRQTARAHAERHYSWTQAVASLETELLRLV